MFQGPISCTSRKPDRWKLIRQSDFCVEIITCRRLSGGSSRQEAEEKQESSY